jgi:hypothetical protein
MKLKAPFKVSLSNLLKIKTPYKLLSTVFISTFIFGCSSTPVSIQNVAKPDINQPINESETIIQLKRADYFMGRNNIIVVANDKSIGELANGDELVWKTNSNSLECISHSYPHESFSLKFGVKLEDTPAPYKCFKTKPKVKMTLTHDFFYPEARSVREVAFTPIFKLSPAFDRDTKVTVSVINSIPSKAKSEKDIKAILEDAVKKRLGDNFDLSSGRTIDIEILDYKAGNAATRWLVKSMKGSTFAKVKVTIKEGSKAVETFITRPVISSGGGFSIGADEYIFDEVAEDIYLHLFGRAG